MREVILIIVTALLLSNCISQKENKNLQWIESQTLCVYWSSDFDKRDTLSAVNFIVKASTDDILKSQRIYFKIGDRKYSLKKTKLIDKEQYYLQGLKLECRTLYEDFEDDIYAEDGPCYENTLYKMVNEGELFLKSSPNVKIEKSDSFKLHRGLKEK